MVCSVGGATVQASAAPTLSTVNTTLAAPAAAGATSLTLASAAGVTVGQRYLIGGAETLGGEWVTVRSVAGAVVIPARPLRFAQASGATFQATRLTFAIGAGACATPARNYRVQWVPAAGDEDLAAVVPFDVTRYLPTTSLSIEDLRDLDPLLAKRLPNGTVLSAVVARAWDILMGHLSQKVDPGGVAGVVDLTLAHGYLVRALLAETAGRDDETVSYLEDMRSRYAQERDNTLGALAYDASQTGAAKNGAGSMGRSIPLVRR